MFYKNIMEKIVLEEYDKLADCLPSCKCEQCRNDVIAMALNLLPPKYITTLKGELYSKLECVDFQQRSNVIVAITKAAEIVASKPGHDTIAKCVAIEIKEETNLL